MSPSDLSGKDTLNLISCGMAAKYWIYFGVPNPKDGGPPRPGPTNIVGGLFQSVYEKIGLVEHAQYEVFRDLSLDGTHDYYREFYRSNSGDGDPAEAEGAFPGGSAFKPQFGCIQKMIAHGYVHKDEVTQCAVSPGMVGLDSLQMYCIMRADPPVDLPKSFQGPGCESGGLFQLAYVPPDQLASIAVPPPPDYPRTVVEQPWETPRVRGQNAFGMDLVAEALGGKELFVRASPGLCVGPVAGFSEWCRARYEGGGKDLGGQVWPDPTPRFQVRLFP